MRQDIYDQFILSESDIYNVIMAGIDIDSCYTEQQINISSELELTHIPKFQKYVETDISVAEFDSLQQQNWHMPAEYKNLDIAAWVLDQCQTDEQRQRAGQELLLYLERDAFPLLQYLKYLVDTMRKNNIVWGVGRGSSVASYVLYLIGIHRIDSLYYSLDINEFLR